MKSKQSDPITTSAQVVCEHYGLTFDQLIEKNRKREVKDPRQIAMWLCRQLTHKPSHAKIGRQLGGRNHSTVIYAERVVNDLRETDKQIKTTTDEILSKFILQVGEHEDVIRLNAEWITGEITDATEELISNIATSLNKIEQSVNEDAVMEGWRKAKIKMQLEKMQEAVNQITELPKYRNSLYQQVKRDIEG